jgi:hypothetical protein
VDGNEATVARSALQRLLEDGLERLKAAQAAEMAAQLGVGVGGNCHHGNQHPEGAATPHDASATTGLELCSTPSGELTAVAEQQLTTLAQPEDVAALKRLLQSPSDSSPAPPLPVSSHADASVASPPTTPTAAAREAAASEQQQQHDWVVALRTLCQLSAQGKLSPHSQSPPTLLRPVRPRLAHHPRRVSLEVINRHRVLRSSSKHGPTGPKFFPTGTTAKSNREKLALEYVPRPPRSR